MGVLQLPRRKGEHSSKSMFGQRSNDFVFEKFCSGNNTPYEGPSPANSNSRKLKVLGQKWEGIHSLFYCYFDTY